jgi:hypothetical protein
MLKRFPFGDYSPVFVDLIEMPIVIITHEPFSSVVSEPHSVASWNACCLRRFVFGHC